MSGFWDQPGNGDDQYRDGMDETAEGYEPPFQNIPQPPRPPQPQQQRAQAPVQAPVEYEEDTELLESLEDAEDEDDYSSVLNDAGLRLEQGNLYKLILNHDIFEGQDADPRAVKAVQRQIRKFAKEQMEIMLGMRRETAKVESLNIEFPFNAVEVDVLKRLALAASKGASANSDNFVPKVTRTTEEVPVAPAPRKEGLNRIGGATKPAPAKAVLAAKPAPKAQAPAPQKPLPQKPAQPVKRKPLTQTEAQILAEEGVTREELEATFDTPGLNKPLHEMTDDEKIAHNARASSRRQKTVKNPSAMPMPSSDQEMMIHQTRVMEASANPAMQTIMALINNKK